MRLESVMVRENNYVGECCNKQFNSKRQNQYLWEWYQIVLLKNEIQNQDSHTFFRNIFILHVDLFYTIVQVLITFYINFPQKVQRKIISLRVFGDAVRRVF